MLQQPTSPSQQTPDRPRVDERRRVGRWMARLAPVLSVAFAASPVRATVLTYRIASGGAVENAGTLQLFATLESAREADGWVANDTITCEPGLYPCGPLSLNVPNLTLSAANCTFQFAPTTSVQGLIRITAGNVRVLGPLILRNTGTQGCVIEVNSNPTQISDFLISDVLIDQCPATPISPIRILQSGQSQANTTIKGTLDRVRIHAGAGHPDGIYFGDDAPVFGPRPSQPGVIWLIDCEVDGCDSAANSNAVAVDTRGLAVVLGGAFSGSGGSNLIGASSYLGRLFAFGVQAGGGLTHPMAASLNGDLQCEYVENCTVLNALTAVTLLGPPGTPGFGVCRNSTLLRDPTRWSGNSSTTVRPSSGVRVLTAMGVVEGCTIEGWRYAAADDFSGNLSTAVDYVGLSGGSCLVRHCWLKNCFRGVNSSSASAILLDVESCLITQMPVASSLPPFTFRIQGNPLNPAAASSMRLANNVVTWEPGGASSGSFISITPGNAGRDGIGGSNYFWHSGSMATLFEAGWTPYANDTFENDSNAKPIHDAEGNETINSPAAPSASFDVWGQEVFVQGRTAFGNIIAGTATNTQFSTSLAQPANYFNNQTLRFFSGANNGSWRRIVASTATGLVTVTPALPNPPAMNDLFMIRPPTIPSSGTTQYLDPNYYSVQYFENAPPLSSLQDDCNTNGQPDADDIAGGLVDCNSDAIPDECENDCNTNGSEDSCDLAALIASDCNTDAIPDACNAAAPTVPIFVDRFDDPAPLSPAAWAVQTDTGIRTWRAWSSPGSAVLLKGGMLESAPLDLSAISRGAIAFRLASDGGRASSSLVAEYWDGSSWQMGVTVGASAIGINWTYQRFDLSPGALAQGFRMRFRRTGTLAGAWFLDDVTLLANENDCDGDGLLDGCELDLDCDQVPDACQPCNSPIHGDMNCDGLVNPGDVCGFVDALLHHGAISPDSFFSADMNADGRVDADDSEAFLLAILGP